jgi:predicted CXXCH cytochrome family protein
MKNHFHFIFTTSALIVLSLFLSVAYGKIKPVPLTEADCHKCHTKEVNTIKGQESAHKNDIGCFDCHEGHPPMSKAVIPKCSQCHSPDENRHFKVTGCKRCHNPHAPLVTDFTALDNPKPVCITCHTGPGKDFSEFPSKHSEQDCRNCHEKHGLGEGKSYTCLDCHERHAPELTLSDCTRCHKPHKPSAYIWPENLEGKYCGACHIDFVTLFDAKGGAHRKKLDCVKCHNQHPPRDKNVIPSCNKCHKKKAKRHFTVAGCTRCHNPHALDDLDIAKAENVKPACLSCHPKPGKQMEKHPSAHSEQDCNSCHKVHGTFMQCIECHEPHSDSMKHKDCLQCHEPHQPALLAFRKPIPPVLCGSCHEDQVKMLAGSRTKHGKLNCIYCHKRKHATVLTCKTCHGKPHPSVLHKKFPDCHQCHGDPHDLRK